MNRRDFLGGLSLASLTLAVPGLSGCDSGNRVTPAVNKLNIPPLLDSAALKHELKVKIQKGQHEFVPGRPSQTAGYNGSYLGPTIRLYDGQDTTIHFHNQLDEATTVHGHGLHVPGNVDGGPQSRIEPGETATVTLKIRQRQSTNWYHPHLMGTTAHQVHSGLAGLYLVEDQASQETELPAQYGVNDVPLVIQDRTFNDGVMKPYKATTAQLMTGVREDTLIVNGTIAPYFETTSNFTRLRVLNGSNARVYELYLDNGEKLIKLGTEGGFLAQPVAISSQKMSPGERNDLIVDTSGSEAFSLMARMLPTEGDKTTKLARVVEFRPATSKPLRSKIPSSFDSPPTWARSAVTKTRDLQLTMDMPTQRHHASQHGSMEHIFGINGRPMDINRIDFNVELGAVEIWRITSQWMEHPFHMHGVSFKILWQNGKQPPPEEQGWKDVVLVEHGVTEVIAKFEHPASKDYPYMFHCHTLEHEDAGMMGQYTVT